VTIKLAQSREQSMNHTDHHRFVNPRVDRIRSLNDALRTTLTGGRVMFTRGVAALGPQAQREIIEALRRYDEFDADNDPYGEHDFGMIVVQGHELLFKIDYYDRDLVYHSPDAADPSVTTRVLTIMLADEY
jgi:hypothetical protein